MLVQVVPVLGQIGGVFIVLSVALDRLFAVFLPLRCALDADELVLSALLCFGAVFC